MTLGSQPTDAVLVRISVDDDNSDVHALPGLLQFTAATWNTAQTVTVRADADAGGQADTARLTHRAAGGDYTGVTVTVTDDDVAVEISQRAVTLLQGEQNTYTVRLGAAPAGPVTVDSPDADVEVGPAGSLQSRALVLTANDWNTPQAVKVTGGTVGSDKAVTVTHTVSGYGAGTTAEDVMVMVTVLTATGALQVDPLALVLVEDGPAKTYMVRPRVQPTAAQTMTVNVANTNAAVSAVPLALTFEETNWAAQAVTVRAATDSDTTVEMATLNRTVEVPGSLTVVLQAPVVVTEREATALTLMVPDQAVRVGQRVNVRLPGATGGNAPLSYELMGPGPATTLGLPAGLTFDPTRRRIQGTPQMTADAATYRLTVEDANGDVANADFTLTVEGNPLPGFREPAGRYTRGEPYPLPAPECGWGRRRY